MTVLEGSASASQRGNIRNEEIAILSRIYSFDKMRQWMPRNITPTDIDSRFLVESSGEFLWFEFKTNGQVMPWGQEQAMSTLLYRLRPKSALFVFEHPSLEKVDPVADVTRFQVWKWDEPVSWEPGRIHKTQWIDGRHMQPWIEHWFKHADGLANSFITTFRKAAGVYPGEPDISRGSQP